MVAQNPHLSSIIIRVVFDADNNGTWVCQLLNLATNRMKELGSDIDRAMVDAVAREFSELLGIPVSQ
jgi:hypothetical protein